MDDRLQAPFTDEQVKNLNAFQKAGYFHPFTCGKCSCDLVATKDGWICPTEGCGYTQDWAHGFMGSSRAMEILADSMGNLFKKK